MTTLIAEIGTDRYEHKFGGAGWTAQTGVVEVPPPVLLLTLDLSDPRLDLAGASRELPLFSRVDASSTEPQSYVFDAAGRSVTFEGPGWNVAVDPADLFTPPLTERRLVLRPAQGDEDPALAPSKYEVQDTFLGGSGFIRVRGEPVWLADAEDVVCTCGKETEFVAGIGYERYNAPSGIVSPTRPFFLGELALYFFACLDCRRVVVVSQPS
jgi:hypothetical protein